VQGECAIWGRANVHEIHDNDSNLQKEIKSNLLGSSHHISALRAFEKNAHVRRSSQAAQFNASNGFI